MTYACPPSDRRLIGITGAQGVGKSTFAADILKELEGAGTSPICLMAGLGERMADLGIPLGSQATATTIPAVYAAHLERELAAPRGITILDRCVVDALAYTRCLGVLGATDLRLYEAVSAVAARSLSLVIHLQLSPYFEPKGGSHESPDLRQRVAQELNDILEQISSPVISLDASNPSALAEAKTAVLQIV